uniref:FGGY_N domain-containing protein n=1 Tax=Ascaris lumbricoides TaxID=6252 RepID=A0A0M3HF18_ASCLU
MCAAVGIDVGTTSVKICVVGTQGSVVEEKNAIHNAWIKRNLSNCREQDTHKIFETIFVLLSSMRTTLRSVHTVAITGQMHGIVFWNGNALAEGVLCCSPLITWMDSRIPQQFISTLPRWQLGDVHNGYGMVILAWLSSQSLIDPKWDRCGTIMDMLACYITQLHTPLMGIQNAFSWGYCTREGDWTLADDIVPSKLRPKIVPTGTIIGKVSCERIALPLGAKVFASLGDLQSTVYPLLSDSSAVLNLGTSAQLCFRYKGSEVFPSPLLTEPFFDGFHLITAASMNGGNAVHLLAEKIVEWASSLSSCNTELQLDFEKFEKILKSASDNASSVNVQPTFYEERAEHSLSIIRGLLPDTTITELLHATAKGVISNLSRLLPANILRANGVTRLILAGNAGKAPYVHYISEVFDGFEVVTNIEHAASAAYGAALFALKLNCT